MGSIVSGLFGKGGSGIAGQGIEEAARRAESAYFKPYTVRTGTGTTSYGDGGFSTQLSPEYQALLGQALTGAGGLLSQFQGFDPSQRAAEIYGEQAALLQPGFEQQATALQSRLFGGGRLGLRLAGESQGLGAGSGMVQPDALGLGRAQQQTLAQLAAQSRGQALGEQAQLGQMAQGQRHRLHKNNVVKMQGSLVGYLEQGLGLMVWQQQGRQLLLRVGYRYG
jgi:hypothetical protein